MDIEEIIPRLEGVKRTGRGKYVARCPAHSDRSPSLMLKQSDDRILIHCFSGCQAADVVAAIGLELKDLFPDRPLFKKEVKDGFNAYDALRCLKEEALIVLLAASDCLKTGIFSNADLQRVQLAHDRINAAYVFIKGRLS